MLARREIFKTSFRLPTAKMDMISVRRNFFIQWRQISIQQQVMVSNIRNFNALGRHTGITQPRPEAR